MPNVITRITATPVQIRSGDTTSLSIDYESMQLGTVELRPSAPFKIVPANAILAPDPDGRTKLAITIQRRDLMAGPLRCDVIATFFDSSLHFFVEIQ